MDQLNEVVKYILYRCRENNTPITEIMANFIAQTILNTSKFMFIQGHRNFIYKISYQNLR
jgi:predicted acetyltransferase